MTIKLNLPQKWDELSLFQLQKMALLFNTQEVNAKFDLQVFYILLNLKWWQFIKKARMRIVLWNVPMSELRKNYEFVYKENNRTIFPEVIKIKKQLFYAPHKKVANLTADEFSVADDLHIKFRSTKNIEYLHYLAAVLYTNSKTRPIFDKNELHDKAIPFAKVPVQQLFAIEIAYFGCKNTLVKRFPKVFPAPVVGAIKPKKNYGFGKVILSMAKGDLSKVEKIKRVNIFTFLEQFEEDLITASKSKK